MIDVYKIGLTRYIYHKDLNSGYYEYSIIKDALSKVETAKKVLVIIGGKPDEADLKLNTLISNYDYNIFICTDIIAFTGVLDDVISKCDLILHQSVQPQFEQYDIPNTYSYVPELFYKDFFKMPSQSNLLLYGGGLRDNKDLLLSIFDKVPHNFLEKAKGYDNRLEYSDYIRYQRTCKYSLVLLRKENVPYSWVTSRFVEAISAWSLPIVHSSYDPCRHFGCDKLYFNTPDEAKAIIEYYNTREGERVDILEGFRETLNKNKYKFVEIIDNFIKEQQL